MSHDDKKAQKKRRGGMPPRPWARRVQIAAAILLVPAVAIAIAWPDLSIAMGALIVVLFFVSVADRLRPYGLAPGPSTTTRSQNENRERIERSLSSSYEDRPTAGRTRRLRYR